MKKIITIGIDLAKNVFAVHAVDALGQVVWTKPAVKRHHLLEFIGNIPPCVIGMEACTGAHHWAREFGKFDHTIGLVAPKFVIPYRLSSKRGKNNAKEPFWLSWILYCHRKLMSLDSGVLRRYPWFREPCGG